jgi:ribonuclease BN (tRNA processing enzyme)
VTILGTYSPFAPGGGAGPSYWVECGDSSVLVDCGPGALAAFQEHVGPLSKINTVILSHLHFDHMSDFMVLRYAASPDGRYKEMPPRVTVYAPSEPESEFELLSYKECVTAKEIPYSTGIKLDDMQITFFKGEHGVPSYAMRFENSSGIFTYSGDSRPCPALIQAAKGADLFLCEASAIEDDAETAAAGHVTARQAGELARKAGVKNLLLTHLWPLYDQSVLLRECSSVFGRTQIAVPGAVYYI